MELLYKIVAILLGTTIVAWITPYVLEFIHNRKGRKYGAKPVRALGITFPLGVPLFYEIVKAHTGNRLSAYLSERFTKLRAKTARNFVLGRYNYVTVDPENIKAILATQFKDFGLGVRNDQLKPLLGDGIFTLDGAGWTHSRALLRPQFARDQISHLSTLENHVSRIIDIAKYNYANKSTLDTKDGLFDIQEIFFKFSLDTATEFLFGESVESLKGGETSEFASSFASAFNDSQNYCAARVRAQYLYFLLNSRQFKKQNKVCHNFVDYYVEKALKETASDKPNLMEKENRYIFLYALTQETRDPLVLRNQCLNILLAARDTTSATMSFAMHSLAVYPRIFEKLRKIVLEEFGTDTSKITFESLKRSQYLRCFINEVLRFYPAVPNNIRIAFKDTTLPRGGGDDEMSPVFVEKGTGIMYSVSVLHRLKEFYGEDANEFKPERWEGRTHSWEYLPFNGGPRICLGQQLALTEISYVVVRLLQTFKQIVSTPERIRINPEITMNLTASSTHGVYLSLVPA